MSQIYKSVASTPAVPIQFTTDVKNDTLVGPGNVIPAANNLNVFGSSTVQNNSNGIRTDANPNNGEDLYVELTNRISLTTTTTDATPTSIAVMTPVTGSSLTFTLTLTAYDSANNLALGGEQIGLARSAGGTVTVIGTNDTFDEYDGALAANDWEIQSSGANLILTVTGVVGHTIDWYATFNYIQVT